ncbi:GPR1/FUN34/YaaH family transporter [Streptomyces montanisoli]|uniref:Uncharacterized protein n=1 Tax=Streptomyces montanisoli TaxID=2798581 RepID=A0A940MBY4_9ACTN|nr:GPR1/FUN34/YaaH family transporter [Streptomyces montanisoli]MBP0456837.1 hypothetical protein [Streptomyces montanisoli]
MPSDGDEQHARQDDQRAAAPEGAPGAAPVAGVTRVVLRPIASSLPVGFFAFLAFVVPLELIAGVFAYLARDAGAATALTTLGAAWAGTAVVSLMQPPGTRSTALVVFLLVVAAFVLVLSAAALPGKSLLGVLLVLAAARYVLVAVYDITGSATVRSASGWLGVALGAFALYGGIALLLEEMTQRTVLPLGRHGRSRTSLEGGLEDQTATTHQEAGVRRQL